MATEHQREQIQSLLTEYQRDLVEEYYKFQSSLSLPDDAAEQRLCSIWEEAQNDSILCRHLEFVDSLCNFLSEGAIEKDNDNRAYWAEYLISQLQAELDQEEGRISATALEGSTWLVKSSDGQNLSKKTLPSDDPQIMQQFKDQMCSRCQTPYSTHRWTPLAE